MRARVAVLVAALIAAAVVVVLVTRGGDVDGELGRARGMLDDDDRFLTAFGAGDTLARVGELLQAEGERCRDGGSARARCDHLLSASAAAQVMAYRVLSCTAPGRFEARTNLAEHLDAIAAGRDPGDPPAPPDCES